MIDGLLVNEDGLHAERAGYSARMLTPRTTETGENVLGRIVRAARYVQAHSRLKYNIYQSTKTYCYQIN